MQGIIFGHPWEGGAMGENWAAWRGMGIHVKGWASIGRGGAMGKNRLIRMEKRDGRRTYHRY